jgi:hypothetical protein
MKTSPLAGLLVLSIVLLGVVPEAGAFNPLPGWPVEIKQPQNRVPIGPKINYFKADGQVHIVLAVPGSNVRSYDLGGKLEWMLEYNHSVYDVTIWGDFMAFPETDWDGQSYSVHLLRLSNLQELPGWPRSFSLPIGTCPVVITLHDSNGDNAPEAFFSLYKDTLIHALDLHGNELDGWPACLEEDVTKGYSLSVEDMDGDGKAEIVALGTQSVQVFSSSGEMKDGFPVRWAEESFTNVAAPVVMDIDADGCMEIIVATCGIDPHQGTLRVFRCDGSNPWNYRIEGDYFHSPVAVFTHNEVTYIAAETEHGELHLLSEDGHLQPGWPVEKEGHGDGLAAVEVRGRPVVVSGCNLNVSHGEEVESYLHFHTLDGAPLAGTPLLLPGFTSFAVPTFFDSLMVVATFRVVLPGIEQVNTVYLFESDFTAHHWPMYGHDPQNSNNYHSQEISVSVEGESSSSPEVFVLHQNYPNPFNAATRIDYELPLTTHHSPLTIKLEIFDLVGRRVATLVDREQETGNRKQGVGSVVWEPSELSSGVYFYKLTAGDFSRVRRMTVLK